MEDPARGGLPEQLGDFRIASVLGEGGSGIVYAAQWGHREVALKVLRSEDVPSEGARRRFLDEARILAGIEHPSVVKVLSFGELPDGRPYLAMEKLDGENLGDSLRRRGRLELREALDLFDQIASAVAALHGRGLIHRDLKPENVFLVSGGRYAVLLDFGIAKDVEAAASTVTQEGLVRGTPAYMAPERFFGAPARESSDIYELGVMLFAMVTGRLPWASAEDPEARLNPVRPSDCGVALPGALEQEILRALSTRPESRPPSADDMARAVRESLDDPATIAARATVDIRPGMPAPAGTAMEPPLSASAEQTLQRPSARRSFAIAAIGVAVGAAGLISAAIVLSSSNEDGGARESAVEVDEPELPADPAPTPGPTPTLETVGELPPIDPDRPAGPVPRQVWGWHSVDTNILIGVAWGDLQTSKFYANVRKHYDKKVMGAALQVLTDECGFDPTSAIAWGTLAVPRGAFTEFEAAAGGGFTRADFERCLLAMVKWSGEDVPAETRDGAQTVLEFRGEPIRFGWPTESTFLVTNRNKATRNWMDQRVAGKRGAALTDRSLGSLRKEVDLDATLWVVAADASGMDMSGLDGVPTPRSLYASLTVKADLTLDVGWRYDSDAQAAAAAKVVQASLDKLKQDAFVSFLLTDASVSSTGKDVRIHIFVDERSSTMIAQALVQAMQEAFKDFPK